MTFPERDTDIGGNQARFPATQLSAVQRLNSTDASERSRAVETIVAAYWKPAYKYIRAKWNLGNEPAKDLTQGFFAKAIEKGYLERYDPDKAGFRTFLRTCLDGFIANERKAGQRVKRGGGVRTLSLDFENADSEYRRSGPAAGDDLGDYFHREWVRSVFGLALEELHKQSVAAGKLIPFRIFQRYDLDRQQSADITYQSLANEYDLSPTTVTNYLSDMRRRFREIAIRKLRETTGSDAEFQAEARSLLGVTGE